MGAGAGMSRVPSKRPLRNKVCFLCGIALERAAAGRCGRLWSHLPDGTPMPECFWVKAIAEHGALGALALSDQRQAA